MGLQKFSFSFIHIHAYGGANCFKDIYVDANPISVRLKLKRQRIKTADFYLRDISTPLVGVISKHIDQIQEPLIHKY